jgi:biotin operon repressor
MTQTDRLLRYLRENPGTSSLEITRALGIVNVTGRVSDLRAEGHVIEARRDHGVYRYRVVEAPVQMAAFG